MVQNAARFAAVLLQLSIQIRRINYLLKTPALKVHQKCNNQHVPFAHSNIATHPQGKYGQSRSINALTLRIYTQCIHFHWIYLGKWFAGRKVRLCILITFKQVPDELLHTLQICSSTATKCPRALSAVWQPSNSFFVSRTLISSINFAQLDKVKAQLNQTCLQHRYKW